ncbi:MAG: DUF3244 domain-containing protein [Bacteroidales bacterium]|nr:DUF3244 domain-containing protein [Bacteroidales bacterium]
MICDAYVIKTIDGNSRILIKESHVQGVPKGFTISATIDSHTLVASFSQNIGQVQIEVSTINGVDIETSVSETPNGVSIYIPYTGSYIVTFTLPNGDEYYGEFEVTD